jgi:hypothetical protein
MKHLTSGRRAMLVALCACMVGIAVPATAQDPRASEAQAATLAWLVMADRDDGAGTYNEAAKRFRDAISQEQWTAALAKARDQYGPTVRRTLLTTRAPDPGKDTPPGEFLILIFRSEFGKHDMAAETVTMERETDGKWRVVGYLMR